MFIAQPNQISSNLSFGANGNIRSGNYMKEFCDTWVCELQKMLFCGPDGLIHHFWRNRFLNFYGQ